MTKDTGNNRQPWYMILCDIIAFIVMVLAGLLMAYLLVERLVYPPF